MSTMPSNAAPTPAPPDPFVHEMFDHPACPVPPGCPEHDYNVPDVLCDACDIIGHAVYDEDIAEIIENRVERDHNVIWFDSDGQPRVDIPPDCEHWGPTKFLMRAHEAKGYCALHLEGG